MLASLLISTIHTHLHMTYLNELDSNQNSSTKIDLLRPQRINPYSQEPRDKKRKIFYLVIVLSLALLFTCSVRRFTLAELPKDASIYDPITLKPKKIGFLQVVKNFIFHSNNFLEGQADDRINILLLGMGGVGHEGPFLTDTSIILSFKPSTRSVAMISVPRDLGVTIDGHGQRKINNASSFGEANQAGSGGEYARQIFAKTFDLNIPYYIRVDFKAFEEIINTVGGLTIDVKRPFVDNLYPGENYSYAPISFEAGVQNMNGERALQYVRSRHGTNGENSDFARSKRQQQVLAALKAKLLSLGTYTNPVRIQQIINSLTTHVTTNLDFGEMMYLASEARSADGEIKTLILDDAPKGYLIPYTSPEGAWLLAPKTENFNEINTAIKNVFASPEETKTLPPAPVENKPVFPTARIEIQNGTWRAGLASRIEKKLEDKGLSIAGVGNSLKRPLEKTTIYLINPAASGEIVNTLKAELKAEVTSSLPEWLSENYDDPSTTSSEIGTKYKPNTEILIILGEELKE